MAGHKSCSLGVFRLRRLTWLMPDAILDTCTDASSSNVIPRIPAASSWHSISQSARPSWEVATMKKLVIVSVVAFACSALGTARAQVAPEDFAKLKDRVDALERAG